jgi:hypothetical protein
MPHGAAAAKGSGQLGPVVVEVNKGQQGLQAGCGRHRQVVGATWQERRSVIGTWNLGSYTIGEEG